MLRRLVSSLLPVLCVFILLASCSAPAEEEFRGLRLLNAGEEPRALLRYDLAAFSPASMAMTMKMESVISSDDLPDNEMTTVMPSFVMNLDTTDHVLDDEGHLTLVSTMGGVAVEAREGVDPAIMAVLEDLFDQMTGIRMTVTMDDRGQVLSQIVDFGGMDPALRQQMEESIRLVEDMVHGFPEQPVGVGAQWEEREVIVMQGVEMAFRTVYTLVERVGNEVTLDLQMEQTGTMGTPDAPPVAMSTTGGGRMAIRLDRQVQEGTMRMESTSSVEQPGTSPFRVRVLVDVTVGPAS